MSERRLQFQTAYGKRQILVVDDEDINRELLGMVLETEYQVLFAENGSRALELINRHRDTLSLVILDLLLPDINGLEILKTIKADGSTQKIPVIVMTSEQDAEVESLQLGAIDFIPKPYPRPEVILARVLRTIELSEDRDLILSTERDPLTGLYNKDYFYRYAQQYDQLHREEPMDAVVVDVNHFHMLNERYGKAYADGVLCRIGEALIEIAKSGGGIVCRREADNFLLYCPHRTDYEVLLKNSFTGVAGEAAAQNRVRLRVGVYEDADKDLDIERRFDRAKNAADTVRNSFTRSIGYYSSELHEKELYAEQLIEDFHQAVREGQFTVFYQPKFDVRYEVPVLASAEALVRWRHPKLGMISPGVFIPLFEDNGLIRELDNYVWHETARQIRDWKDRLGYTVPVSVNVSRIDMYDPALIDTFTGILKENGLASGDLLLEITESAYTQDSEQIIETVNQLRELGFQIEMDDFGTGYSSLNMISTLPIDALKLDMQFVRNAFSKRQDTRMLEVILDIADYLSVPVIAEGVETKEQLDALKTMGCDLVQGYYFSRPQPAEEYEHFIIERKAELDQARNGSGADPESGKPQDAVRVPFDRIAQALAADYFTIYYVDMETEDFIEYSASDQYRSLGVEIAGINFFPTSQKNILRMIYPDDIELLRTQFTKEILQDVLSRRPTFTLNYRLMLEGVPTWVSLKACRMSPGDRRHIVIGVRSIHSYMKRLEEFERAQEENVTFARIADALSRDYFSIYYVDTVTDEYIEYSSHNEYKELELQQKGEHFFEDTRQNILKLVYPEDRERALSIWDKDRLLKELEEVHSFNTTYRLMLGGRPRYLNLKVIRMAGESCNSHIVVAISDVDAQIRREQERDAQLGAVRAMANRDALTGVKSKHAFDEKEAEINAELAKGEREPFAVVVCDINGLKQINDSLGHKAGDQYIKDACRIICETFKHSPVYRIGGDEFVAILRGGDFEKRNELMSLIEKNDRDNLAADQVVIAFGMAEYDPERDQGFEAVFERADVAMYENKKALKEQ